MFKLDTYALVHFDFDNSYAIVSTKRLEEDNLLAGEKCNVIWSKKEIYTGTLMYSGKVVFNCQILTV